MVKVQSWLLAELNRQALVHSARTAVAALVSLAAARVFRLPEAYWAAITTLVVMQSTLGAALEVSWRRFAGTALGALAGAVAAAYFPPSIFVFAVAVFGIGLLAAALHLDRTAYRFASITVAIIMLVERHKSAWIVATHRFVEVSVGIAVALVLTAIWPEHSPATEATTRQRSSV
jgi:uncharacterized membrane protein YccC